MRYNVPALNNIVLRIIKSNIAKIMIDGVCEVDYAVEMK